MNYASRSSVEKILTILVVEGARASAGEFQSLTAGLPIRLLQVATLREAFRVARAEKPDAILLDADRPEGETPPEDTAFGKIPVVTFRRPFGLHELARILARCLGPRPARCPA